MKKPKEWYASQGLMDDLREAFIPLATKALKEGKEFNTLDVPCVNFAYTDYGGTIFERAAIAYWIEKYPENIVWEHTIYFGKNAIIFGDIVNEWIADSFDYLLGFRDFEEYFFEYERECEEKSWEFFVEQIARDWEFEKDYIDTFPKEKALEWLREHKSGYYSVQSSGDVDFCWDDLEKELLENLSL